MAFPLPDHLPRKASSHDISSEILSKIDAASYQTLDSSLASSWVTELDQAIRSTEGQIHDRIQEDLPKFERQLQASKSVQLRLQQLTQEVDTLNNAISDPQKGLVPVLVRNLTAHSALAQEAKDAEVAHDALSHLLKCKIQYTSVMSLVQFGKLPEAVVAFMEMASSVDASPKALKQTSVLTDLKRKVQTLKASVEEQLSDAFSSCVEVRPSVLTVRPSFQVHQSDTIISLSDIASSLSPDSLSNHLATFRRDFTAHFVDHVLQQPYSAIVESSPSESKLSLIPSSPNTELRITRLENISSILDFVAAHLLPILPLSQSSVFPRSLCKPITSGILNLFIIPSLPPSFGLLPPFLTLVKAAEAFEEKYVLGLLGGNTNDRPIITWSDSLCGHYEKRRRVDILERSRLLITESEDPPSFFQADVEKPPETAAPTAVNGDDFQDDAWGFEDDSGLNNAEQGQDTWGFDDDAGGPEAEAEPEPKHEDGVVEDGVYGVDDEADPSDAWGWNDDTIDEDISPEDTTEDTVWDDPWSDPPPSASISEAEPHTSKIDSPKAATRLEKLATKNKKHLNGHTQSPGESVPSTLSPVPRPRPLQPALLEPSDRPATDGRRPAKLLTTIPKEKYRVTDRMKRIIRLAEDVIAEGKQFTASNLFSQLASGSFPGATLFQTASSALDLYQALFPVKFGKELESLEGAMQFSNDCFYLSDSLEKLERETASQPQLSERLSECRGHLKVLSDSWFDDAIEKQCLEHDRILTEGTQGFTYTGDQDRYDECESAINQVVRDIKDAARRLKRILSKTRYYSVVGRLTDAALARVLQDTIALPDIPELESHRLSELSRIFNSLEGLFSEDPAEPSFVVAYVPSWLKFSYLSELMEASMADITYLFEQGALVDFETEELIQLVRALFADTALRTNTINKILSGHVVPSS